MNPLLRLIIWPFVFVAFMLLMPTSLMMPRTSMCRYRHDWMKWALFGGNKPLRSLYDSCFC